LTPYSTFREHPSADPTLVPAPAPQCTLGRPREYEIPLRTLSCTPLRRAGNAIYLKQLTQETLVMWRGKVVERGPTAQVLDDPHDDYTKRLRASVPHPGWKPPRRLHTA
jgi:hypothetical protein